MNFRKLNNVAGWITGLIALVVYLKTMEPTVSFWDCGEFLSCAYKLEGGHAPGFPTLMMLQRLFALLAGVPAFTGQASASYPGHWGAATYINSLTSFCSAFTILFLFWTISWFAKRMVAPGNTEPTKNQTILILGSAFVGALAYTFSDTFWFSAVEAIPFGTSPFFTAFTFWCILKWERESDKAYADRWLLLISLVIGLAVGVHLLILLVIPPIALVYYYKRYDATVKGFVIAFLISVVILAFIMFGIIRYIPKYAFLFDYFFTNSLGMHFDVGAIVFLFLVAAIIVAAIYIGWKRNLYYLHMGALCTLLVILGYSTYFSAIIRARANVPVNMTNPSYPNSFLDYVDREQFGQAPLLFGPYYNSVPEGLDSSERIYSALTVNGKDHYEWVGKRMEYTYGGDQKHFFPRIYDGSEGHANFYRNFLGLGKNDDPSTADNFKFFFVYQMDWMWWRFFMWNYAGRQNDMEGQLDPIRGNWITGIGFLDQMRGLGDTTKMGPGFSDRGHTQLYLLPFALGILGLIFQFNTNRKDGVVLAVLFFFTGIAIGIFLNMPPVQPRERDYAFAGCTYAFAMWIGLGVLMLHQWLSRATKDPTAAIAAVAVSVLAVPVLEANQEWPSHDRSRKTLARAVAFNTLSCLDSNAVLFTYGDNQTYPLWYMQEVEGFRKDVRIINTSLLGIDWYIDELNYRINDADAVPMIWKNEDYLGDRHNYVQYFDNPALHIPKDKYFNLADICNFMNAKEPEKMLGRRDGETVNFMPTKNFFVPSLSKSELVQRGWINATDTNIVTSEMKWNYPKGTAYKTDLAVLNIIAGVANGGWKRPLYFDAGLRQGDYGGAGDYFHLEGDVYHLLPFRYVDSVHNDQQVFGSINTAKGYDLFLHKFMWGGGERNDVYFDEPNRREFITYRMDASFLANALVAEGHKDSAVKVLDEVVKQVTEHSYYYDFSVYYLVASYYRAGAKDKAHDITVKLLSNISSYLTWASSLGEAQRAKTANDIRQNYSIMQSLNSIALQSGDSATSKVLYDKMMAFAPKMKEYLNVRQGQQQEGAADEEQ